MWLIKKKLGAIEAKLTDIKYKMSAAEDNYIYSVSRQFRHYSELIELLEKRIEALESLNKWNKIV